MSKIFNHPSESSPEEKILMSPLLGEEPNFGLEIPGYTKRVFHQLLPKDRSVAILDDSNAIVYVFVKDVGFWFQIGQQTSQAYWYRIKDWKVTFENGREGQEVCVYELIPDKAGLF